MNDKNLKQLMCDVCISKYDLLVCCIYTTLMLIIGSCIIMIFAKIQFSNALIILLICLIPMIVYVIVINVIITFHCIRYYYGSIQNDESSEYYTGYVQLHNEYIIHIPINV